MTAIQEAVQNSIENLAPNAAPAVNAAPLGRGGQYAHPARTREELMATQQQAAVNGTVSAAAPQQLLALQQSEAAMAAGDVDMFAQLQSAAGMVDPASQGGAPQQAEAPRASQGDDWII